MKKTLFAIVLLAFSGAAVAHQPHAFWRHQHQHHPHWIWPAIVGGAVVYEVTRPPVVVQTQPPLPPVYVQQPTCGPWMQIQNADGSVTTTRTCTQ